VALAPVAVGVMLPLLLLAVAGGLLLLCLLRRRRRRKRAAKVGLGPPDALPTALPEALSAALIREFHRREGRDPTEAEKLALLSELLHKAEVELTVAGCPKPVLAAARADYEAHTGAFAMDHHALAYMRGLLGDRRGLPPGDEPLEAELLIRALRAEVRQRLGREPSIEQIRSLLGDLLAGRDEAGPAGAATHPLHSVPAEVLAALRLLGASPDARGLLRLGRRLVREAAAGAGIPLPQVEAAAQAQQAAPNVRRSFREAELQPTFSAQHEFSAEAPVSEEVVRQKQNAPTGAARDSVQLTEMPQEEHQAATFIATIHKGRLAQKAVAAKRAQQRAASAAAAATSPAPELVPLQSATRLALAQEHRRPPPAPPSSKARAAPQLPPADDFTDVGAAAPVERGTSAAFERPADHRAPPRPAPAEANDRLARAIAARSAFRSARSGSQAAALGAPGLRGDKAAAAGPTAMQRMAALRGTDTAGAAEAEQQPTLPPPPIEEGVQHRKMPMPPPNARRGAGAPPVQRQPADSSPPEAPPTQDL
jgi:hypothetical protein